MLVHPSSWAFTPCSHHPGPALLQHCPTSLAEGVSTGAEHWHWVPRVLARAGLFPGTDAPAERLRGLGCRPPVLGRENYLQGVHLIRCWAHTGASSCCLWFTSGEAVTLPVPMGSRNSWSTFQSKHDPQHLTARAVEKPTLAPLPSLPRLQLPQLQDFAPTLVPPLGSVFIFCTRVPMRYTACWQRWAGLESFLSTPSPADMNILPVPSSSSPEDMNILSVPSSSSPLTMSPVPQGGFGTPSVTHLCKLLLFCRVDADPRGRSGYVLCSDV